jgi:hypothetical protein
MSVRRCQQEVSSAEFGEWLALWQLETEGTGEGEPSEDQLSAKIGAWGASMSGQAQRGVTTLERVK